MVLATSSRVGNAEDNGSTGTRTEGRKTRFETKNGITTLVIRPYAIFLSGTVKSHEYEKLFTVHCTRRVHPATPCPSRSNVRPIQVKPPPPHPPPHQERAQEGAPAYL